MALPVNFKDDVLASSMDGKRRYNMITNSDGTVSFEDVTTYSQEGSNFGSAQINNTNGAINTINNNVLDTIEEISANTSGGKFAGALALKNVNNSIANVFKGIDTTKIVQTYITSGTYTATKDCYAIGRIRCSTSGNIAIVYIDGVEVYATGITSSIPILIPMKKGQKISFNNMFAGQVIFYGIK